MGNTGTKPQSSMSNGQMQTRGLSAADWTRLKRLNGAKNYKTVNLDTDKDISPTVFPQLPHGHPIQVYRSAGTSKIRRAASDWIAYKASQTADFPSPSTQPIPGYEMGTQQLMIKLCDCTYYPLETKVAGCSKCRHDPIENYLKTNYNFIFEDIVLNQTYNGVLSGRYTCPIPTDFTNYVKMYKITFDTSNTYDFNLICNTGDQDLYISYPNTPITVAGINAAMTDDYCDTTVDLSTYFTDWANNSGSDSITLACNSGETYYILVLSYIPDNFEFSVVVN